MDPIAGNRYVIEKNGTLFRKQAAQMRPRTSMLEMDYPICIRRMAEMDINGKNLVAKSGFLTTFS